MTSTDEHRQIMSPSGAGEGEQKTEFHALALGLGVRSSFRKSFSPFLFSQDGVPINYQSFLQVVLVLPGAARRPTDSSHRTLRLLCSTSRHIQPCSLVHRSFQVA